MQTCKCHEIKSIINAKQKQKNYRGVRSWSVQPQITLHPALNLKNKNKKVNIIS